MPGLWAIRVAFPEAAGDRPVPLAEAVLEPFGLALSSFERDGGPGWTVEALCERRPAAVRVRAALRAAGLAVEPRIEPLPQRDWVAESERALPPFRAGRFFVHGSHVTAPAPRGSIALRIDAGMAFGTGRHATTRGCLLALDRLARSRRFARPLDLGCGSGILAIAAARLWRVPVLAADNDPQAVAVARENARRNGVGDLVRSVLSEGYRAAAIRRAAPFDLVLANILARPLQALAPALARHLLPGGLAILSGLTAEQEEAVLAAHRRSGLAAVACRRIEGWSILALERPE